LSAEEAVEAPVWMLPDMVVAVVVPEGIEQISAE
jgi:hypothetical protein